MNFKLFLFVLFILKWCTAISQTTYFEDFNATGYPNNTHGYWDFYNEIHPSQDTWDAFVPGDGNAYIIVDADISNDTDEIHPYQTIIFGGVGENHRIEVRMKGAVVDGGLVAFLFTYHQVGSVFNEVDIEIVANDRDSAPHDKFPPDGWTDARFNTWRNADEKTTLPHTGSAKAVVNASNDKISLMDDQFHTYTIDWRSEQVDFFIDDILQETFTTNIATGWSEVIIGFRNLPWADNFKWSGTHTLVIDYFKIEPLAPLTPLSLLPINSTNPTSDISIFPNPTNDEINIIISEAHEIQKMELINILSASIIQIEGYKKKIDISNLPKGLYFLKAVFSNGKTITKKIVKL